MKEKIFDKMIEYGWNLEDWNNVYDIHYNFIQNLFDYFVETDEPNCSRNLNDINEQSLHDMIDFMSDFVRAVNDIDKESEIPYENIMIVDKGMNTQETKDVIILNDRNRVGNETTDEMIDEIYKYLS